MLDDQVAAGCQNGMILKMLQAVPDKILVVGRVHESEVKPALRYVETVEVGGDIPANDT